MYILGTKDSLMHNKELINRILEENKYAVQDFFMDRCGDALYKCLVYRVELCDESGVYYSTRLNLVNYRVLSDILGEIIIEGDNSEYANIRIPELDICICQDMLIEDFTADIIEVIIDCVTKVELNENDMDYIKNVASIYVKSHGLMRISDIVDHYATSFEYDVTKEDFDEYLWDKMIQDNMYDIETLNAMTFSEKLAAINSVTSNNVSEDDFEFLLRFFDVIDDVYEVLFT